MNISNFAQNLSPPVKATQAPDQVIEKSINKPIDLKKLDHSLKAIDLEKAIGQLVGEGMFGVVSEYHEYNRRVIKVSKPGAQNNFITEAIFFNKYYGPGTAETVRTYGNQVALIMNRISGQPLTKFEDIDELFHPSKLEDMLIKLRDVGIMHNYLKAANILWDNLSQTLHPIDFGKSTNRENSGDLEIPNLS